MDYRQLGNSGLKVSRLCLGTMMFGGPTSRADSIRMIHAANDQGINFVDSANVYCSGESEKVVGEAISDRRDAVVLATKARLPVGQGPNDAGASRGHLMRELEASLDRLQTDYVDLFYVHAPDDLTPIEETLRTLDDMVRSGKVRYLGCSNYRAWQLCEALWTSDKRNLNRFTCVQPLYNAVNRDVEVELLPLCQKHGVGVVSYSPLARGVLTGKYQATKDFPADSRAARGDKRLHQTELREANLEISEQLSHYCEQRGVRPSQFAVAWCLASPVITSVIMGPRTQEQYQDYLSALEIVINPEDEHFVDNLVPPGEHSGKGFPDPSFPVVGRGR